MKTIKIFIASSNELEKERLLMASLANELSTRLEKVGIQVIAVEWESLDASMGENHKQEEYNEKLRECDMCMVLYWTKFGMYTKTELDTAYKEKIEGKNPQKVWVYFKEVDDPSNMPTEELKKFRDSFPTKYGHFYTPFANFDTLKAHFLLQFMEYQSQALQGKSIVEVKDGKVTVDGKEYVDLKNVPFAGNNEEYNNLQKLIKKNKKLLEITEPDDPDYAEYASELQEQQEKLAKMESSLWDTALMITKLSTTKCSERLQRAMNLFNQGDNKGAQAILNEEEIEKDIQHNLNLIKLGKEGQKGLEINIEEYRLRIKTIECEMLENWDKETDRLFKQLITISEHNVNEEIICSILWDYSCFLIQTHQHSCSIDILKKLLKNVVSCNSVINTSEVLMNLARSLQWTENYKESEKYYLDALKSSYKTTNIEIECLIGLGDLNYRNNPKQAEAYYSDALVLTKSQQASIEINVFLSRILNNMANLYRRTAQYSNSLESHMQALDIRKTLAKQSYLYQPLVAFSYKNIGDLYIETGQYIEARDAYVESLKIRRELAKKNPVIHNKQLAMSINGLGRAHKELGNYEYAIELFQEALAIRRELANHDPEAYNNYIARSLDGIGTTYLLMGDYENAKKYLIESLSIRENLYKHYPELYEYALQVSKDNLEKLYKERKKEKGS